MDSNQKAEDVVKRAMPEIVSVVDPELILPHLPCIPRPRQNTIRCKQQQSGKEIAVLDLIAFLYGRDDWFNQLCCALKHPAVGCLELAGKLEDDYYRKSRRSISGQSVVRADEMTPVRDLKSEIRRSFRRLGSNSLENWQTFADKVGYTVDELGRFEDRPNPAEALFRDWVTRADATLGTLVRILRSMDRDDILTELTEREVGPAVKNILRKLELEDTLTRKQSQKTNDAEIPTRFGKGSYSGKFKQRKENSETYKCDTDTQKYPRVDEEHFSQEKGCGKHFDISDRKICHEEQQTQPQNKTDGPSTEVTLDEYSHLSQQKADSPTFPTRKVQPGEDETPLKEPHSLPQAAGDTRTPPMRGQNFVQLGFAAAELFLSWMWPKK